MIVIVIVNFKLLKSDWLAHSTLFSLIWQQTQLSESMLLLNNCYRIVE